MSNLFICNTYYQLIVALQLKLTYFKNSNVDLWLSDRSVNSKSVCAKLSELNIFNTVEFKKFKHNKPGKNEVAAVLKSSFGILGSEKFDFYDEVIFFNPEMILFRMADYYSRNHINTVWSKMEEGIFSYENDFDAGKGISTTKFLRKKFGLQDIASNIKNYYCFFPELKVSHKEWNFIKIPPITENLKQLKGILNYIFDYKHENYKQKYIYFASSSDIDNLPFGETEAVLKISKMVGVENLLVKIHPRDTRKVYEEKNIAVLKNSYVPWEVIHMNLNEQKNVLLTIVSGAFVNISALMEQSVECRFIELDAKTAPQHLIQKTEKIKEIINKLHSMGLAKNISMVRLQDLNL